MTAEQLLADLARSEITLFLEDDRLRYRAPEGALTRERRAAIAEHRAQIIERLRGHRVPRTPVAKCIHCDRQDWVDDPPKDDRIRTTCGKCGRFIGFRPEGR